MDKKTIKIVAPSRNYTMTKKQIESKADEIYVDVESGDFKVLSFSRRHKKANGVNIQLRSYEELKKHSDLCHANGVEVQLTANIHYVPQELVDGYINHIKNCIDAGVDKLVISDISVVKEIRKRGITTPIIASSYTFTPNSEMVKFLEHLGVSRIVLPQAISISEISRIKEKNPNMEIEVVAFIGGGNNCGRCLMAHSPMRKDIAMGCRALYDIQYDGKKYSGKKFLDAAADCSLCSMPDLISSGVSTLKIFGRESKNESIPIKLTKVFHFFREGVLSGLSVEQIKEKLTRETLFWQMNWVPRFCENKKCKFHETDITNSYI
ncbi:MAG: U32 family peptidase [Oscillospiraceae bacterium]|nr:U32 family peptidase [Oscillospiraceae bacterium]